MLDAYQQVKGVDEKQRFVKKRFVTEHAIKITCPDISPEEVNDFLKEIGEMRPEEPLKKLMQKKVDRDFMLKAIEETKYDMIDKGRKTNFGI